MEWLNDLLYFALWTDSDLQYQISVHTVPP